MSDSSTSDSSTGSRAEPVGEVGCVVVAAGSGTRLAAGRPKAFVPLAGRTLLEHAVGRLLDSARVGALAVVVPGELVTEAAGLLRPLVAGRGGLLDSAGAGSGSPGSGAALSVVAGGSDRAASVRLGLAALPAAVTKVLVHDAARCLVPPELVRRVVAALDGCAAVVPGLPLSDTVKQVDGAGTVVATPDRAALRLVQTPQGFTRDLLERAHRAAAGAPVTDDAGLVERLGAPVRTVPGDPRALKITTPGDLAYAEWLLSGAP